MQFRCAVSSEMLFSPISYQFGLQTGPLSSDCFFGFGFCFSLFCFLFFCDFGRRPVWGCQSNWVFCMRAESSGSNFLATHSVSIADIILMLLLALRRPGYYRYFRKLHLPRVRSLNSVNFVLQSQMKLLCSGMSWQIMQSLFIRRAR